MKNIIQNIARAALAAVVCACLALPGLPAMAVDTPHPVGYTVRAILPENNLDGSGYFNLLVQPGQRQIIEVEITNQRPDAPLRLRMEINGAYTNANGLIEYSHREDDTSPFAKAGVAGFQTEGLSIGIGQSILSLEGDIITIAPNATVRLPIVLAIPQEGITGQLLGGIVLTKLDAEPQPEGASFSIQSLYSYAIALQLQTTREHGLAPDFALRSVAADSLAGWDAVSVSIENRVPLVITGAQLRLRVQAEDTDETVLDITNERVTFAPNAVLPYKAALGGATLPPGAYTVTVEITQNGNTASLYGELIVPA